jgi:outer membrane receptor for ferric coprogen and ferric-rhodotorulic acid
VSSGAVRGRVAGAWQARNTFVDLNTNRRAVGYGALDWDITPATTLSVAVITQQDRVDRPYSGLPAAESGANLNVPRSTSPDPPWARNAWDIDDYSATLSHHFTSRWELRARVSRRNQDLLFHDAVSLEAVRASDYTEVYSRRKYEYDYGRTAADLFVTGPVELFGRTHTLLVGYNYDALDTQYRGVELSTNATLVRVPFDHPERVPIIDLPYDRGGRTETRQRGLYAQARVSILDSLTLLAGARLSHFETRSHNVAPGIPTAWRQGNGVNAEVTPFAGLVYDVNSFLTFYGSYSSIFLPQSTSLRADGSSLDPRVGAQFELGAKAAFFENRLNASVARFELHDRNRALADPGAPGFFTNAGKVESKGWETEISGNVAGLLDVQAGYARLDTIYVNAPASRIGQVFDSFEPRHTWRLWGVHHFDGATDSKWSVGLGLNGQSKLPAGATPTEPRVQGGFSIVNAMLAWRLDERLTLDLNATNLLDKTYYARIGGSNSYNTFGEPRGYSLTARYGL